MGSERTLGTTAGPFSHKMVAVEVDTSLDHTLAQVYTLTSASFHRFLPKFHVKKSVNVMFLGHLEKYALAAGTLATMFIQISMYPSTCFTSRDYASACGPCSFACAVPFHLLLCLRASLEKAVRTSCSTIPVRWRQFCYSVLRICYLRLHMCERAEQFCWRAVT